MAIKRQCIGTGDAVLLENENLISMTKGIEAEVLVIDLAA
jgi:hypothetical protein